MKKIYKKQRTVQERFLEKFIKGKDNECWEWTGSKNNKGYGELGLNAKKILAHRYSFIFHKGEIPKGLCVCHSCDNPPCVNPKHLWLGTIKENYEDALKKGRKINFIAPSGEKCGASKLTEKQVIEIKRLRKTKGLLHKDLAKLFNCCPSTIGYLLMGKTWKCLNKHLPQETK